jgi:hypothetical protein
VPHIVPDCIILGNEMLKNGLVKLFLAGLVSGIPALVQAEILPFNEDNWAFIAGTEIKEYNGQQALQLGVPAPGAPFGFGMAIAKVAPFANGVIEYDVDFGDGPVFAGARLRVQGQGDFEDFYMRGHQSGNPDANQYMPQYNGMASWELYNGAPYSAPTTYLDGWNRVKLVISGALMDVFINDMDKPAFTTVLKREEMAGGFALWGLNIGGAAWFANVDIKAGDDVQIVGTPVPEAVATDATVINWEVSETFDRSNQDGSTDGLSFGAIAAEASGMLNLARVQGVSEGNDTAYARVVILSDRAQVKAFELGFSDVATLYLNGQALFAGNDTAYSRDYRFLGTVGFWDTIYLNLEAGENELLIAVSENVADVTGWGVQARFGDMDGLSFR